MPNPSQDEQAAVSTNLPVLIPSATALVRRTQTTLGLLRDVVQESSADYWYELGKKANEAENWVNAISNLRICFEHDKNHWRAALQMAFSLANEQNVENIEAVAFSLVQAYDLYCKYKDSNSRDLIFLKIELQPDSETKLEFLHDKLQGYKSLGKGSFIIDLALSIVCSAIFKYNISRQILNNMEDVYKVEIDHSALWHNVSACIREFGIDESINHFNLSAKIEPGRFTTYFKRANVKRGAGDIVGAIADYDQTILINPKCSSAYIERADTKVFSGDIIGAINDYSKVIELDPNAAHIYCSRGRAKAILHNYEAAVADYRIAIRFNKKYISWIESCFGNDPTTESLKKHTPASLILCDLMVEFSPDFGYNYRGEIRFLFGDKIGAIADYDQAIELRESSYSYSKRSIAKLSLGDQLGAAEDQRMASFVYQRSIENSNPDF